MLCLVFLALAGCATAPGDERTAAERLTSGVFEAMAKPVAVVVDTVAGPALDEAEDAANRIHEFRQSRRHRRDARALCLADPSLYAGACAIAFPNFSTNPPVEQSEAPPEPRGAPPAAVSPVTQPRGSTPPAAPPERETALAWNQVWNGVADSVREHEGLRLTPYPDRNGVPHIGYGHRITPQEAEALLARDLVVATAGARTAVGADVWSRLASSPRGVLVEMAYVMGATGLAGFDRMITALRRGDRHTAADEILDSDFADQVGDRAEVLALRMRYGAD